MSIQLQVKNSIQIKASMSNVWDALTNPEKTKIYMFGCQTVSDWNPGSELLWKGNSEGKEMIFVKGIILEIEPEKLLKYTVIDPAASYPDNRKFIYGENIKVIVCGKCHSILPLKNSNKTDVFLTVRAAIPRNF